jgi:hypothetical protein
MPEQSASSASKYGRTGTQIQQRRKQRIGGGFAQFWHGVVFELPPLHGMAYICGHDHITKDRALQCAMAWRARHEARS